MTWIVFLNIHSVYLIQVGSVMEKQVQLLTTILYDPLIIKLKEFKQILANNFYFKEETNISLYKEMMSQKQFFIEDKYSLLDNYGNSLKLNKNKRSRLIQEI